MNQANPINLATEFMHLSRLGKATVLLVCLTVSLLGIDLVLSGVLLSLLGRPEGSLQDVFIFGAQMNATLSGLAYICACVPFILWFRGRFKELGRFNVQKLEYSTKKAVYMFFIPIVNLVQPVHIAQEIWRASDPSRSQYDPQAVEGKSRLIRQWWGFFLLYSLCGNVVTRINRSEVIDVFDLPPDAPIQDMAEPLFRGLGLGMGVDVLGLIAGLLLVQVVLQIEARQRAKRRSLEVGGAPALA